MKTISYSFFISSSVINFGGKGKSVFDLNPIIYENIGPLFASLNSLSPVKCSTGRVYTYTRKPDVVVADVGFTETPL